MPRARTYKIENKMMDGKFIEKKESVVKRNLYKEIINRCCLPDCIYGNDLETHHIIPLKSGGDDSFENFIVLCKVCHRRRKLHRLWKHKRQELYTYKLFVEMDILGLNDDCTEYSDQEFWKKLRFIKNGFKDNSIKKKDEIKLQFEYQTNPKENKVKKLVRVAENSSNDYSGND